MHMFRKDNCVSSNLSVSIVIHRYLDIPRYDFLSMKVRYVEVRPHLEYPDTLYRLDCDV